MIANKKQLKFFCQADMMMNRGRFRNGFIRSIYDLFCPDYVMRYLKAMRHYAYYMNTSNGGGYSHVLLEIPISQIWV